jgi:YfiH family protein
MDQVVVGRLRHGNEVTVLRREDVRQSGANRTFSSDAAVTDVSDLFLFLTFADCVPLLFWDRHQRVMGAAHAGWRGTALGIGPAVVATLQRVFRSDPANIVVGIGPSIGPCCYTVGPDVLLGFEASGYTAVTDERNGEIRLDLWASTEQQLCAMGIAPDAIENPRICTSCQVDTYYSHRAEHGRTGRFALCAGLV